ncbi:MAG TPA: hypothetical protein VJ672_13320 [Gemmatimonadaceae bacterium]|nr:hypothetical protein [Gemmatimonadaceae bacterium]
MYALYSPEHPVLERVRRALPSEERGWATTSWNEFAGIVERADCLLVACRWLSREVCLTLRHAACGASAVPVILITTKDADNARSALNSGATHIVWLSDAERELSALLYGARRHCVVLDRAARLIERSTRLSPPLRRALVFTCRTQWPVCSISELASLLNRNRRTLWRHWHQTNGTALRLEDFIDWVLLLHAAHEKSPSRSWADVAHSLGTHEHTLARLVRRLANGTLGALDERARADLERRFLAAVQDKVGPGETFGACAPAPPCSGCADQRECELNVAHQAVEP